ncbi:MAG: hypothetical protein EOM10_03660 [Opitutae bacterium]|nr:hypothetical protein [Opitutae bacterium]
MSICASAGLVRPEQSAPVASPPVRRCQMTVISFGTRDGVYDRHLAQLAAQCDAFGLRRDLRLIPPASRIAACLQKPAFIREMLECHQQPVLWLDADTRINRAFELPGGRWDLGLVPNSSWRKRRRRPTCAFVIAAAPTPSAHAFLDAWAYLCANPGLAPGRTDHSRLTWTREMLDGLYAEINLSRSLHGALTRDPGTRKEKTI